MNVGLRRRPGVPLLFVLVANGLAGGCATGGFGGGGGGSSAPATGTSIGGVTVGQALPDLDLSGIDGKRQRLSDYRGKVVLLDVWASWCEPCKVELPMLDDIAGRLRARGVQVLAVSVDQEALNVRQFLKKRPHWKVQFFHDPYGRVPEALQPPKMPTSYVLDRDGVVRLVNQGFERADAGRIERTLSELAGAS